jgi:hypothetical protein
MNVYIAGNLIADIATFTQADNVTPVDPTTVQVNYTVVYSDVLYGPNTILYSGSIVPSNGSIARLSPGQYELQLDTTLQPGYWTWQWYGTGTGQALLPVSALVHPSTFLTPYELL